MKGHAILYRQSILGLRNEALTIQKRVNKATVTPPFGWSFAFMYFFPIWIVWGLFSSLHVIASDPDIFNHLPRALE